MGANPSGPLVVGLPVADQALDGLAAGDLLVQDLAGQRRQLLVAREAQRDQLAHAELGNAGALVRRQQLAQPHPHLVTDEAILDGEREVPEIEPEDDQRDRHQHLHDAVQAVEAAAEAPEVIDPDERPQQVEQQDGGRDEVIERHVAAVGCIALGCLIGHGTSWSRKRRWSWLRPPGREAAGGGLSTDRRPDRTASPSVPRTGGTLGSAGYRRLQRSCHSAGSRLVEAKWSRTEIRQRIHRPSAPPAALHLLSVFPIRLRRRALPGTRIARLLRYRISVLDHLVSRSGHWSADRKSTRLN